MSHKEVREKEIRKIVLETIVECWDDTHSYIEEGDDPLHDFMAEVRDRLKKLL